jgi:Leucine-rich repeat (LRR) protein
MIVSISSEIINTVKLRAVDWSYYSILNSFEQRSQYISIKLPLHRQSENPELCY